jgi:malate synthase
MATVLESVASAPPLRDVEQRVLTSEAAAFVRLLEARFGGVRRELLERRARRNAALRAGSADLHFDAAARAVRSAEWQVAQAPPDLERRHVEITGPVERKMMIHALNSGADCFMADFEDSLSPTWSNVLHGHANLYDAVRRTIAVPRDDGSAYTLNERTATLLVRPRGWHLDEPRFRHEGRAVSAALFDFGLHFFHNAHELIRRGSGPYFYLPKLESHLEARLWHEVFTFAQRQLGVPHGSIRATVLVETLPAAFEMDEILFELREHASGLNAGRWDYIFSAIKLYGARASSPFPDRSRITMTVPFMRAYTALLVATCHRRGAHAMGGMAAFVPNRRQPEVTAHALQRVQEDKQREALAGFDGTWVAHPDLVPVARQVFDEALGGAAHQKHVRSDDVQQEAERTHGRALVAFTVPDGVITEAGVRTNIRVALEYMRAWLGGQGAVAIDNLMEDVATAEISRIQLRHWIRHAAVQENGTVVTADLYRAERDRILDELADGARADGTLRTAAALLDELVLREESAPFLTLDAMSRLD